MQLHERARAKVNLTLRVLGRRPDGYHELQSVVAFAGIADGMTMDLAAPRGLMVTGPFADELVGHANLVEAAMAEWMAAYPSSRIGHVVLDKQLPVAAGIGGGSADAAAMLRLIRAANPEIGLDELTRTGALLGADVPVCITNQPAVMTGTGTDVAPLGAMPALAAILVNPLVPVPSDKTAAVFKQLAAPRWTGEAVEAEELAGRWSGFKSAAALIDALARESNDLEEPALAVMPVVAEVLAALRALPGTRLARLSGAGPTCFALFQSDRDAALAAAGLHRAKPQWWVMPTVLEGSRV